MRSLHVSRVIVAEPEAVYAFVSDPENLPRWAAGLASSEITRDGDRLHVGSPLGQVTVTFAPRNAFGIVDHDVLLPSGGVVNNPVRVMAHPDGAEIVFTVRQVDLGDEEFERDAATVGEDLDRLKGLIERGA